MSSNKLVIISNYFPPDIGGGSSRVYEFVEHLSKYLKIYLFTRIPYIYDNSLLFSFKKTKINNYFVNKVKLGIFKYLDALKICNFKLIFLYFLYLCRIKEKDFKILISTPPAEPFLTSLIFSKIFKKRVILDLRDDWINVNYIKSKGLIKLQNYIIKILYKKYINNIDLFICINNSISDSVKDIINKKIPILIIPNIPNSEIFSPNNKVSRKFFEFNENDFIISYAGNLDAEYINIEPLLHSFKYLKNKRIKLLLIGFGRLEVKYKKIINKYSIQNMVEFLGKRDKDFIAKIYSISDICLVPLSFDPVYQYALPSKLFEILSCKKAVLAFGPKDGELSKIVENNKLGIFIWENNEKVISKLLLKFYNNRNLIKEYEKNSSKLIKEKYNYNKLIKNLVNNINRL